MEAKFKVDWDYLWWKQKHPDSVMTQNDWNQTLVTRINQLSAQIHMSTLVGGANKIIINKKIFSLIEYSINEYTQKQENGTYKLNRCEIVFDDTLPLNKIYVLRDGIDKHNLILVEGTKELGNPDMSMIYSESDQVSLYLDNPNVKIITPDMLVGEITLLNI